MKILLLPMGGIGNMLMFTPAIEKLKKAGKARIKVLMTEDIAKEVLRYSGVELTVCKKLSLKLALSLRKEKFDICLIPYPSSGIRKVLFAKIAGCKKIVSHPYFLLGIRTSLLITNPAKEKKQHDIDSNLDLLKELGIKILEKDKRMMFRIDGRQEKYADDFFKKNNLKNAVGIHPGSRQGMAYKRWPLERYNQLIEYLSKKYKVLVFFGSDEEYLIKDTFRNRDVVFISNKSIHETTALIKKCKFFISNDSGLMHIAVSQNVPTIGIFGPTIYWRTYPYGKKNITLKSNLPCVPCYNPYAEFRCKNIACLDSIRLEEVKNSIKKLEDETKRNK